MSTIGASLKEARTKQSLSLDDVHAKIKIHPRVLQLIEEERFDKLPSPVFAKSFLRSYAEFLSLDVESLLKLYEQLGQKESDQTIHIPSADERYKVSGPSPKAVMAIAAGLVLTGLFFLGAAAFRSAGDWAGQAQRSISSFFQAPQGAKPAKTKKAAAAAVPAKTASKSAQREWIRSADQGNFPTIEKGKSLELRIKAVDNVWLRVTCDGKIIYQSILRRGTAQTWTANEGIEIWTGNSSNMSLTLNGHNLGSPGKGVVKKMVITRQGVKIPS